MRKSTTVWLNKEELKEIVAEKFGANTWDVEIEISNPDGWGNQISVRVDNATKEVTL